MKMNKYVLGTMCAASVFASCTNEELVNTGNVDQEIDAKQIELLLSADYAAGSDAESRMALIGKEWAWVDGDQVGALRVGNIKNGGTWNITNTFATNHPFEPVTKLTEPVKNTDFSTNTAVYEGNYVFYHQYNGDMISTGGVEGYKLDFPAVQSVNPADINEKLAEYNFFVSPVINIAGIKNGEVNKTAVQFIPMYAILEVNITNDSEAGDLNVNKVVVNGSELSPSGILNFTGAESNIAAATQFVKVDATADTYADDLKQAIDKMNKNYDLLLSAGKTSGNTISAVIEGGNLVIKKGESKAVRVLIPAGKYAINSTATGSGLAIKSFEVYTDKGMYTIDAEAATGDGTEKANIEFTHTTLKSLNPKLTGKATNVTKFTINNMDDWNSAVAYAENNNFEVEFNLAADLKVTELPSCPIYVTGNKTLELAGENMTLVGDSYFENVKNTGTINLTENVALKNITNYGTINVASTEDIVEVATQSYATPQPGIYTLTNRGTINIDGTMTVSQTSSVWNNAAETSSEPAGTINVKKDGKLILEESWTNNSYINVDGIVNIADSKLLTNTATTGVIEVATATGKFVANGTAAAITNNGFISLDAIKDVFLNGNLEQRTATILATSTGHVQVAVTSDDFDGRILPTIEEVNAVEMSGNWNKTNMKALQTKWNEISMITLDNSTVDMGGYSNGSLFSNVTVLEIPGTVTLKNSTAEEATLQLLKNSYPALPTIVVDGNLTIEKNVRINNNGYVPTLQVNGTVTNNGVVYAKLIVGGEDNTKAVYNNNEGAKTAVVAGWSTYFNTAVLNNYGTINNRGELYASGISENGILNGTTIIITPTVD